MRPRLAVVALFLLGSACVHPTTGSGPASDRSVITKEQLNQGHFTTVYNAVEGLRRNWLQTRGSDSINLPTQVKVYLDNSLLGGVEMLRNIDTNSISFVRYYDGLAATTRWGLDHGAGVIFVSTRPETTARH
jgi:hypothetical protein